MRVGKIRKYFTSLNCYVFFKFFVSVNNLDGISELDENQNKHEIKLHESGMIGNNDCLGNKHPD